MLTGEAAQAVRPGADDVARRVTDDQGAFARVVALTLAGVGAPGGVRRFPRHGDRAAAREGRQVKAVL